MNDISNFERLIYQYQKLMKEIRLTEKGIESKHHAITFSNLYFADWDGVNENIKHVGVDGLKDLLKEHLSKQKTKAEELKRLIQNE